MAELEQDIPTVQDPPSKELWKVLKSKGMTYDYDTFKGRLATDEGRNNLYNLVTTKGLYKGDKAYFENTFLTDVPVKKKETALPVSSPVAEQRTTPLSTIQNSFGIETVNPTQEAQSVVGQPVTSSDTISPNQSQFGWSDNPTQAPVTPQYATSAPVDQASPQYRKDVKEKDIAKQSTSKEFSNTLLNSNSPLIQNKSLFAQSLTRDVKPEEAAMIQQNFSNLSPEYQQDVANYLAKVQVENPSKHAELVSRIGENGLDQKTKANILSQATNDRLQTAARDFTILEARNKQGNPINPNDAEETVTRYNKSISDMSNVLQQYPEELDRVRKIKAQNDEMTIKDSDSFLTKAAKQTGAFLGGIQNSLLDGAKSTLEWARDISDQASGETDTRGLTDKFVEGMGNFLDSWKAATPTKYKDEKDLQGESAGGAQEFVSQLGAQFGNMALLYKLGAGSKARLVTAGAATTYSQYYDESVRTGELSKDGDQKYALFQSTIQGLLELVSPNFGAAEFEKVGLKSGIKFLKNNPTASIGEYAKDLLKNNLNENVQELTQNLGGVLGKFAANEIVGKNTFDTNVSAEEQMQTVTMTTATTLLASFLTKGKFREYHKQSLDFLRNVPEPKLVEELNSQVADGILTYSQGEKIKQLVNDKATMPTVEGEKVTPSVETPNPSEKPNSSPVQELDEDSVTKEQLLNKEQQAAITASVEDRVKKELRAEAKAMLDELDNNPKYKKEDGKIDYSMLEDDSRKGLMPKYADYHKKYDDIVEQEKQKNESKTSHKPSEPIKETIKPTTETNTAVESTPTQATATPKEETKVEAVPQPVIDTPSVGEPETPEQRTERVTKTVSESGLSKNGQKAVNGILNDTKDAKLLDVLPKAEKEKAQNLIKEIYIQDKKNAPVTETKTEAIKEPVKEKPKTQLQKGQKAGTNTKEFDQFEPTNIREELEQYLAKGNKINEADFQGVFGDGKGGIQEEGKKWKDSIAPDAPSLDQATEGFRFKGDAQEMKDAFESIVRENENRGKVGEKVKAKHKERTAILEGKNNPYESADYEQAHRDLETEKNKVKDEDIKAYNEFAYNTHELDAQAESDKTIAAKHTESLNRVINDPQYTKEDGTFDYDKLNDNLEKGFEPDILEYLTQAEKLGIKTGEANEQIKSAAVSRGTTEGAKSKQDSQKESEGGRDRGNTETRTNGKQGDGGDGNDGRGIKEQIKILNDSYAAIKEKLGEKAGKKYWEKVGELFDTNLNKDNVVAFRANGVVTEKDGKYTFHALGDMDFKKWRVAFTSDVTDQYTEKPMTINPKKKAVEGYVSDLERNGSMEVLDPEGLARDIKKYTGKDAIVEGDKISLPTTTTNELTLLDKRIAAEKNLDKKKILEKKRAQLVKQQAARESLKTDTPTEIDENNVIDALTDKQAFIDQKTSELDAAIEQAEKDLKKSMKDIVASSGLPFNKGGVFESALKLGYLKFKRFFYTNGRMMSMSEMATALGTKVSDGFKNLYDSVVNIFNKENSSSFHEEMSRADQAARLIQDKNVAIKNLYKDLEAAGVPITDEVNFAEIQELSTSKIADAQRRTAEWFRGMEGDAQITGIAKSQKESWVGRVKEQIGSYKEQLDYMFAKHALDYNARAREIVEKRNEEEIKGLQAKADALTDEYLKETDPSVQKKLQDRITKLNNEITAIQGEPMPDMPSGMTDADAQAILDKAALDPEKMAKMDAFAKEFRDEVVTKRINLLESSGIINAETAQNMRDGKREGFVSEMPNYLPLKVKSENFTDIAKPTTLRAVGSKIFGIKVSNEFEREKRYDPIQMAVTELQSAQSAAVQNEGINALYDAVKQSPFGKQIKIINTRGTYAANEDGQLVDTKTDPKIEVRDLMNDHAIPFKVGGKIKYLFFTPIKTADGKLVPHPVIQALKTQPKDTIPILKTFVNCIRALTNYLRLIRTTYNVGFAADNPFRDLGEALTNISDVSKDGKEVEKIRLQIIKNMPTSLAYFFNPKSKRIGLDGKVKDKNFEQYFDEMRREGVMMSWGNYEGIDQKIGNFQADVDRIEQGKYGKNRQQLAMTGFKVLGALSEATENTTRLSVYAAMRQDGYSPQKAAYVAKNITLNFEKGGTATPIVNMLWMFSNAGIQGATRMAKAAKTKNFWRFGAAMTLFAAANHAALLLGMDDDDEDKWIYNTIESKGRTLIYNPFDPKNPIRLPKPYSAMRIFLNTGEGITDVFFGKKTIADVAANSVGDALMSAIDPIGGSGNSPTNYIPTEPIKNFFQVQFNQNWAGQPLFRGEEKADNEKKPDHLRTNPNTPSKYDKFAFGLNKKTGISISPVTLEFLYDNYAKNAVNSVADYGKLATSIYDAATGKEVKAEDVPALKRFYSDIEDKAKGKAVLYNVLDILAKPDNITKEQIRFAESQLARFKNDPTINSFFTSKIQKGINEAKDPSLRKAKEEAENKAFQEGIEKKEKANK